MAALFGRNKTWADFEIVKAADLNAEFDNILNNLDADQINDYSNSVAEMQTQTDPGEVGSESLATSLAGEIERIRKMLSEITGETYWYTSPIKSLKTESFKILAYLPFDGGTDYEAYCDSIRRGLNPIANTDLFKLTSRADATFSIEAGNNDFDSVNKKFGLRSFQLGADNICALRGDTTIVSDGSLGFHFRNISANGGLVCNPALQTDIYLDGSGYITLDQYKAAPDPGSPTTAKDVETLKGTVLRSGDSSFKHLFLNWTFNESLGSSTDKLEIYYDGVSEATPFSGSDLDLNTGTKNYWFFGCKLNNPTWSVNYTASGLPDADGWTLAGGGTTDSSVANGVFNLKTGTAESQCFFSRTDSINISSFTLEWKMRINDCRAGTNDGGQPNISPFVIVVRDDSADRSFRVGMTKSNITIWQQNDDFTNKRKFSKSVNNQDWNVYRITSSGSPSPKVNLYINGICMGAIDLLSSDANPGDVILFGDNSAVDTTDHFVDAEIEFFRYSTTAASPVTEATTGNIDDIVVFQESISDLTTISNMATTKIKNIFNNDNPIRIPVDTTQGIINDSTTVNVTDQNFNGIGNYGKVVCYSDGLSPMSCSVNSRAQNSVAGNVTYFMATFYQEYTYYTYAGLQDRGLNSWITGGESATNNQRVYLNLNFSTNQKAGALLLQPHFACSGGTSSCSQDEIWADIRTEKE